MVMVPIRNLPHYYIEMRECEHTAHSALEELYKEPRGGALYDPVRKCLATRDERAGLKGEYERSLIPR